jgi:hypothetical protein
MTDKDSRDVLSGSRMMVVSYNTLLIDRGRGTETVVR